MRRRGKPRSLLEYLAYTAVSLAAAWAGYELRLHYLDQRMERTLEQFANLAPPAPAPAARIPAYQPSEADIQRAHAEQDARHEQARIAKDKQDAWTSFYQPPPRCIYPEDSMRTAVCQANERKQREAFESTWAHR